MSQFIHQWNMKRSWFGKGKEDSNRETITAYEKLEEVNTQWQNNESQVSWKTCTGILSKPETQREKHREALFVPEACFES